MSSESESDAEDFVAFQAPVPRQPRQVKFLRKKQKFFDNMFIIDFVNTLPKKINRSNFRCGQICRYEILFWSWFVVLLESDLGVQQTHLWFSGKISLSILMLQVLLYGNFPVNNTFTEVTGVTNAFTDNEFVMAKTKFIFMPSDQ